MNTQRQQNQQGQKSGLKLSSRKRLEPYEIYHRLERVARSLQSPLNGLPQTGKSGLSSENRIIWLG